MTSYIRILALLLLRGPRLQVGMDIPSSSYQAPFSVLKVGVETDWVDLAMLPPSWNTHEGFKTTRTIKFARLESLHLSTARTIYAVTNPENVETLDIDIRIDGIVFVMLGWAIKYIISVKGGRALRHTSDHADQLIDNYFGNFSHFVS